MKQVALSKVKDNLSEYLHSAEKNEIIITRHGKPAGVLIGFNSDEDWFDYRLENDPRFLQRIGSGGIESAVMNSRWPYIRLTPTPFLFPSYSLFKVISFQFLKRPAHTSAVYSVNLRVVVTIAKLIVKIQCSLSKILVDLLMRKK